jgi:hypothetical protein
MNFRAYIIIGLVMAAILFAISTFFGTGIVAWANDLQLRANLSGQGTIGTLVTSPIIFIMTQDIALAILVTLLWPAVFMWLLLILLLLVLVAGVNVATDIESQTRLLLRWWA